MASLSPKRGLWQITTVWLAKHESRLIAFDFIAMLAFLILFVAVTSIEILSGNSLVQVLTGALAIGILISVVHKGVVSLITCILGVVLILAAINGIGANPLADSLTSHHFPDRIIATGKAMNFILGASMVGFAIVLGYRPSSLFTRNRPQSTEEDWEKYPIWEDKVILANDLFEPSVHVKSLMTEVDRYLLWRYEYVLAEIYGTLHLVRTEGQVPQRSTLLIRDRTSGRLVGKAKYTGHFV